MRSPDWKELLGRAPCGCQERKFIMFEAGKVGMWQALLMALAAGTILYVGVRR